MKRIISLLTLFSSLSVLAADGTITVLNAPIFEKPDTKSKILTYKRKGQTLYIHDQEVYENRYQEEYIEDNDEPIDDNVLFPDPLLNSKTVYLPKVDSKFYKTLVKSGKEAYVLKRHVFIEYGDVRELEQKVISRDDTDYRLKEPLPKSYPFVKEIKNRGQFYYSTGQPNYKFYRPNDKIMDTTLKLSSEFNFLWSKAALVIPSKRFFFGVQGGFHSSEVQLLAQSHTSNQKNQRFYIGPYVSFDLYQGTKVNLTINHSIHFLLMDQMHFKTTSSLNGINDSRTYKSSFSLSPNLGLKLHYLNVFLNTDFIFGANLRFMLPKTYTATGKGKDSTFWDSLTSSDSYSQSARTEVSYLFGLQSQF